jgi:hypothetical protein
MIAGAKRTEPATFWSTPLSELSTRWLRQRHFLWGKEPRASLPSSSEAQMSAGKVEQQSCNGRLNSIYSGDVRIGCHSKL